MTYERVNLVHTYTCDVPGCHAVFSDEDRRWFKDVWRLAKLQGWRTKKICHVWHHYCPLHAIT